MVNDHRSGELRTSLMAQSRQPTPPAPEVCPVCEENVPRGALACPECGADHQSGWREDAESTDALGSDEKDFDYDEYVREEFGSSARPARINLVWWITAIVVIVAVVALYLF